MSSSVMLTLKSILVNGENSYTLDDLKSELGLTNDKSLVNFLLRLLKEEVEEANYDSMSYEKPVIEYIYDYLCAFIADGRLCDIESVIERLNLLEAYINKEIVRVKATLKTNEKSVPTFERDFWCAIERLNKDLLKTIHVSEKYKADGGNYCLLEDMIYGIKNLSFVQEVTTRFPRLLLECNKDGESFFSRLVIFYINALKDEKTSLDDIVYYEMVIGCFLENKHLKVEKKLKDLVLLAIDQMKRTKKIDKDIRSQRSIYLWHLKKKLMGDEYFVESLKELKNKYKCNIVVDKEGSEDMEAYFKGLSHVYHDFTNKDVITIDPYGSLDLDDGISLEKLNNNNYLLGIYIADVSNYVALNSCNDIEARHRGETIYSGSRVVTSMLPDGIAIDCCSLLPGGVKKTVVCFFEIEPNGNIKNHFFTKGIIKPVNVNHLSYSNVDYILHHGCDNQRLYNLIYELNHISNLGLFNTLSIDEEPTPNDMKIAAHSIVSKFMVLANHMAALDAKEAGVPFLYRTHKVIDPQTIIDNNPSLNILIDNFSSKNDMLNNIIGGSFSRASYSTDALPHEGLALNAYAHTTSPIRRYADLANQRLIKLFFIDKLREDKKIYEIEDMLKEIAKTLNTNEQMVEQYAFDYAHVLKR